MTNEQRELKRQQNDINQGKAYHTPKLFIYGNIREVTQNVGMNGVNGDGGMGNDKTA